MNRRMTEEQQTLQQQIMARAMKDKAFRQELLANPANPPAPANPVSANP